ncbi:MAG: hypothetical protein QM594_21560 [Niabella sp.]
MAVRIVLTTNNNHTKTLRLLRKTATNDIPNDAKIPVTNKLSEIV